MGFWHARVFSPKQILYWMHCFEKSTFKNNSVNFVKNSTLRLNINIKHCEHNENTTLPLLIDIENLLLEDIIREAYKYLSQNKNYCIGIDYYHFEGIWHYTSRHEEKKHYTWGRHTSWANRGISSTRGWYISRYNILQQLLLCLSRCKSKTRTSGGRPWSEENMHYYIIWRLWGRIVMSRPYIHLQLAIKFSFRWFILMKRFWQDELE